MGVPVGVRASLSLALARGRFDVVHGFEPGLPSLSYLALRDSAALTVATFFSPERLGYPPGRAQRERLLARVDALLATSEEVAEAAAVRFPGRYELVPQGIDPKLFAPAKKRQLVVMEWRQTERPLLRALVRELAQQPGWELVLLRTRIPASRPAVSPKLRGRMRVRTARTAAARAEILRAASIFVPAAEGLARLVAEAQTAGVAIAAPPGRAEQPELAAAETARMIEDEDFRARRAAESLAAAQSQTTEALADRVEQIYERVASRRRSHTTRHPFEERDWIVADLHLHTSWSHDCSIDVDELLDEAEAKGLGAIAVTDHNVFGGALEAVERARGRKLIVIPGEEVKTAEQGEVIGLFLREEIPRGMSFGETVAAIRAQGGLVYVPHPFDRMHAIPDPATLHRHLDGDRRARGVQRAAPLRGVQRGGAPLRAQVQPHARRRIRRARPRGHRHRRGPDAALQRPGGVPRLPPRRRGAAPPEVARLSAGAEVDGAGEGEGALADGGRGARKSISAPSNRTSTWPSVRCSTARARGLSLRTSAVTSAMPAADASETSSWVSAEPMPRSW